MIGVIFDFAGKMVEVRVESNNVLFRTIEFGGALAPIENLRLDYNGVCKEHPDLKDNDNWKKEAIKRFKDKIKSYNTEEEKINYIINDLKKFGYVPTIIQKKGFRPKKL